MQPDLLMGKKARSTARLLRAYAVAWLLTVILQGFPGGSGLEAKSEAPLPIPVPYPPVAVGSSVYHVLPLSFFLFFVLILLLSILLCRGKQTGRLSLVLTAGGSLAAGLSFSLAHSHAAIVSEIGMGVLLGVKILAAMAAASSSLAFLIHWVRRSAPPRAAGPD